MSTRQQRDECPVWFVRAISNCYPGSAEVLRSVFHELNEMLATGLRPCSYGHGIKCIYIYLAMSFDDGPHCRTNLIIAPEGMKLRPAEYYPTLLTMHCAEQIEREQLYLRPRFAIGPLRRATGEINVTISFEREFSFLSPERQRGLIAEYACTALRRIAVRNGKCGYGFDSMIADFEAVTGAWRERCG